MVKVIDLMAAGPDPYPWPDTPALLAHVMDRLGVTTSVQLADRLNWNGYGWSDGEISKFRSGTIRPGYDKLMAILYGAGMLNIEAAPTNGDGPTQYETALRDALELAKELRRRLREAGELEGLMTQIVRGLENAGVEIPREVSSPGPQ